MTTANDKCQMCGDPKADRSFNLFFGLHMVPLTYDVCLSCRSKVMHNPGSFEVVVRPKGANSGGDVGSGRLHGTPAPPIEAKERCIRCGYQMGTFQHCPSSAPMKPGSPCLAPRKYLNEKEVNPTTPHVVYDEEIVTITPLQLLSADEAKALFIDFEEDPDEERYVEHIDGHK